MQTITVRLLKPAKQQVIEFTADLLQHIGDEITIRAWWERPRLDLGYIVFETGDLFIERYYTEHWYTIYGIHTPDSTLKGWYCNVTRPAVFDGALLSSEDLELDMFVSADRATVLTLDMDEFTARNFAQEDPETQHAALEALAELEHMARSGAGAFAR